jgi:hypothetical protein
MYKLVRNPGLLEELLDKQFEMIGENVKFRDIEFGVKIKEGKKEKIVDWWKVYFFKDEEQYLEWKLWAANQIDERLDIEDDNDLQVQLNFLDLAYGMNYKIKKEGELF